MVVTLECGHGGHRYSLERRVEAVPSQHAAAEVVETVRLTRDRHAVGDVRETVETLLPHSVARFCFLDGEAIWQFGRLPLTRAPLDAMVTDLLAQRMRRTWPARAAAGATPKARARESTRARSPHPDPRERLRTAVEGEATRILRTLTADYRKVRVQIDEGFALRLVDDRGTLLPAPGTGAAPLVGLSVMAALSRCVNQRALMVLDSPFGRLDPNHRGTVLASVPALAAQVILAVTSGEFDRPHDRRFLEQKVAREYRLVPDGPPHRSRFERVA